MKKKDRTTKEIFLISQPRSGSSLLQQILGNHPQIHTLSEPWIMLHPVYAVRERGIQTEYNATWAHDALKQFLGSIPKGKDTYFQLIHQMYDALYQHTLEGTGKTYFLDKTPRYYFIIPELMKIFRVFSSILPSR